MNKWRAPLKTYKVFTAFTLSESLIALGVIGVLAAIIIPTIMNNSQDAQLTVAYKKAYSIANQAYTKAVEENGTGFGTDDTTTYPKFNALKSQLNIIKDCPFDSSAGGKCWSKSGVGLKDFIVINCSQLSNSTTYQFTNTSFITADGMFWMLYSYSATTGSPYISIDVNGEKGPNDWGKDVFYFRMNDLNITPSPYYCGGNLKHNDGTTVNTGEFSAPLLK